MRIRLIGRIALVATMVVGLACSASARTITVTENKTDGVTTSFDLTFSTDANSHSLWMAWGDSDGGTASIADWENSKPLGLVSGDMTAWPYAVPVPDGWGETVSHLRFVLIEGVGIPGAETLEYVQAKGSQYVMTEFVPTGNSAVEMTFAFNGDYSSQSLFCARGSANNANTFSLFLLNGNRFRWDYNANNRYGAITPNMNVHTLGVSSNGVTVISGDTFDGDLSGTVPLDTTTHTFTAGGRMSIFAASNSGNLTPGYNGKFKLYSFKAWLDGADPSTIALDLVPCRKTDGTVCLYNWADCSFLEVAAGSDDLDASETVVAPAASVVPSASSELVAVFPAGWTAASGTSYEYVFPLYVANIATGDSNAINQITFSKIEKAGVDMSSATAVTYADFTASSPTGTIVKLGGGTLTFDQDLSSFTGPVHIEEGVGIGVCSNCFGYTVNGSASVNQRTYVHSGATLVMDDVGNNNYYPEWNAVYYEGDGYPGLGGAFVVRNGDRNERDVKSWWQPGSGSTAVGSARLCIDIPTGSRVHIGKVGSTVVSDFSANGQDVLISGREAGSELLVYRTAIQNVGNLVISNMTLNLNDEDGRVQPKNGTASSVRFKGGARWNIGSIHAEGLIGTATLYVDDMEYAYIGYFGEGYGVNPYSGNIATNNYNKICGPAVLNGDFRMYNAHTWVARGLTFTNEVSGAGGFRPWIDAESVSKSGSLRLNLLYPTNTFEGGIVMDGGSLGVYGERAVPSQDGAGNVSITNGYVYFGRKVASAAVTNDWVNFTMPVTEFVGNGAITNGTGTFQGLVKKGDGTLDYNSQMGGAYLDLQGGTVKFNTQYREEYTNDNKPEGYEPALPVFTTLKGTAGTLDLTDVGGSYTVANIEGSPSVTNGNLTVTGAWTLDAATLGEKPVVVDGTLSFGEDATLSISGDIDSVARGGGFLIARADSITGLPQLNCKGWSLVASGDELRLTKPGFIIIVR